MPTGVSWSSQKSFDLTANSMRIDILQKIRVFQRVPLTHALRDAQPCMTANVA
jgi:hypothetical protein